MLMGRRHTLSVGTWTHKAPEMMEGDGRYFASTDIFSFGIMMSEVMCAEEAEELIDSTRKGDFTLDAEGFRGLLTPGSPVECGQLVDLAAVCCDIDPAKRP